MLIKRFTMVGLAILSCLVMGGCATTGTDGIVEIGPNTYMLGRLGGFTDYSGSAVKARLYAEGAKFCSAKNMVMVPFGSSGQDAAVAQYASAEIQFKCVNK